MIELTNLSYQNESTDIIANVNLHIQAGEIVALCGESGSGKSTLLNIIGGLTPAIHGGQLTGERRIMGQSDMDQSFQTFAAKIGMVFQNPNSQFINPDVYSELAFAMENMGIERHEMQARIEQIVDLFEFDKLLYRPLTSLSGGQKQLVACMASMIMDPDLYLLDEPASNLDAKTVDKLTEQLLALKDKGKTMVIAEHRLFYLRPLVDRYIVMQDGQIVADIAATEFWQFSQKFQTKFQLRNLQRPQLALAENAISRESTSLIQYQISHLNFHYPHRKLSLQLPQMFMDNQDVIGIVGDNGAGKSTLVQLLAGLLKQRTGEFKLNQEQLTRKSKIRYSFVVMQQVRMQLFFESVAKELSNGGKQQLDSKLVASLGLTDLLTRRPQSLSGGQQQLVAIATALSSNKRIILLDEPTSGLDYGTLVKLSEIIKQIRQRNVLIVIVSHDLDFINMTCSRVIELEHGQIKNVNRGNIND